MEIFYTLTGRMVGILLVVIALSAIIRLGYRFGLVSKAAVDGEETPAIRIAKYILLGLVLVAMLWLAVAGS